MNDVNLSNCIINVFKPQGITSQGVVTAVKRALNVKTAGHCGTLDPMATGVLPVMVGRAVKASEYLTDHDKLYYAKMKLGVVTDTGDVTGTVLKTHHGVLPTIFEVNNVLPRFMGEIIQVPPMYSALKVNGSKLYDLARKGIEVERKGRKITIYALSAFEDGGEISLTVLCSRGTYIRTLIEDIGQALGCGATMSALCRHAVGNMEHKRREFHVVPSFKKARCQCINRAPSTLSKRHFAWSFNPMFCGDDAVSMEALKDGNIPQSAITRTEDVFRCYPKLSFPAFYEKLFSNGCEIYVSKLEKDSIARKAKIGDVFRVYGKDGFFALGEAKQYQNGIAIKQIKRF
jgi:tRNA pseudouridine(55) synthase